MRRLPDSRLWTSLERTESGEKIKYVDLQLMKATVLAESSIYFIFSPGSPRSSDVYRYESGRCRTLPFFLKFNVPEVHNFLPRPCLPWLSLLSGNKHN